MAEVVELILRGDGEMVAGETVKSSVKPSAVNTWEGSRTHFFQFIIKPALVRVSTRTSRIWMASSWDVLR